MSLSGELVLESSRAFPDDEEEDEFTNQYRVTFEATTSGEQFLQEMKLDLSGSSLYIFNGKVARGFGEGFLKNEQFRSLGEVYLGGVDGTVDSLLSRPGRRPIVRLFLGPEKVVFALVDTYGLPRSLANEVIRAISGFVEVSKHVVIFHSEPLVAYRGEQDVQGLLFHLKSSTVKSEASSIFKCVKVLPQPNIISGVSAAALTECETIGKNGVLFVTYCETEFIDSISTKPFFDALQKGNSGSLNIKQDFAQLTFNLSRSTKTNLTHLTDSNLYV